MQVKKITIYNDYLAVNAAGFYLWRIPPNKNSDLNKLALKGRPKLLREGLSLLGGLILGANMVPMAQTKLLKLKEDKDSLLW